MPLTYPYPPNNQYTRYFNTTEGLILQYWDKVAGGYRNANEFDYNQPLAYILYVSDPNYAPLFAGQSTDVGGYTLLSPGIGPGTPGNPTHTGSTKTGGGGTTGTGTSGAADSATATNIFDNIVNLLTPPDRPKPNVAVIILVIILAAVAGYFFYKFLKK